MAKAAARQGLVKVQGIAGLFAQRSGGETSADTTRVYDGGELVPDVLSSPPMTENITVSRPFDPVRDAAVLRTYRGRVGSWRTTVSVTYTDESLVALDDDIVYSNALLVRMSEPEVDAESGDAMRYELEFAVGSVR